MTRHLFLFIIGWAWVATAKAQPPMTAEECMAYAVAHNRDVRKARLTLDNYEADRLGAIGQMLPYVSASGAAQYNFGRGIDPETNTYTNVTTFSNGFGVSASMPVFDGLARLYGLRLARTNVLMGKSAVEQQEDQVALQTLQAFVNALYYRGTVAMAEEKLKESELMLRQTHVMEDVGRKSPADVAQMEAQQAEASVEVIRQRNLFEQAMLTLKDVMNWQDDSLRLAEEPYKTYDKPRAQGLPEERVAFFQMESARYALRKEKASLWPTISLSGGWSTSYYKTLDAPSGASWGNQMKNNRGEWVAASLSFPLFGRFGTMTAIRRARNNYRSAQETYEQKREELERLRKEAVMDAEAFRSETEGMEKKVAADSLTYTLTKRQWEEGLSTTIDVTNTSAALLNSRARLLQARLMTILKERLARYYGQED